MFSVMSVFSGGGVPVQGPSPTLWTCSNLIIFDLTVQGPSSGPYPRGHVQTCSLCHLCYRQGGRMAFD